MDNPYQADCPPACDIHGYMIYDDVAQWQADLIRSIPASRSRTHARERTTSTRRRAGSRRGNDRSFLWSDVGNQEYVIGDGMKPNHAARYVDIRRLFPPAPGAHNPYPKGK